MSTVEKLGIAITPEMATRVRGVVDAGEYASASEVVREALRDWSLRRDQRRWAVSDLSRLWDEGLASGPVRDGEAAFERIKSSVKARSGGADG